MTAGAWRVGLAAISAALVAMSPCAGSRVGVTSTRAASSGGEGRIGGHAARPAHEREQWRRCCRSWVALLGSARPNGQDYPTGPAEESRMSEGALSRYRVLDLSRVRAGPTCVRQFADHGASVIKVEAAGTGDGGMGGARLGPDFQNLHRNKRCITLDLKAPHGVEILRRLAARVGRAGGELPPGREGPAGHRLRGDARDQPALGVLPASPASARTGRTACAPASTRSRRAWAA